MAIWFQGCPLACPGCFNQDTHDFEGGHKIPLDEIYNQIERQLQEIEGITISGGEPFAQSDALYQLVCQVKHNTDLSILVFSGYTLNEIIKQNNGASILENIDVLIAGRYIDSMHLGYGLRGSSNQKVHLLSSRYTMEEISSTPLCEIIIDKKGNMILSGVEPIRSN